MEYYLELLTTQKSPPLSCVVRNEMSHKKNLLHDQRTSEFGECLIVFFVFQVGVSSLFGECIALSFSSWNLSLEITCPYLYFCSLL